MVAQRGGNERKPELPAFGQDRDLVAQDRLKRGSLFQEIGNQLLKGDGVQDRTGEGLGSYLGPLLDKRDADLKRCLASTLRRPIVVLDEPREVVGSRQRGGTRPDEQDIDIEGLSLHLTSPPACPQFSRVS